MTWGQKTKRLLLHTEMLKVVPRQNFELCPEAAGRNAIPLWEKDLESSEDLYDTQLTHLVCTLLKLNLNSSMQGEKEVLSGNHRQKMGFVEFPRFRRCCRPAKTVFSIN